MNEWRLIGDNPEYVPLLLWFGNHTAAYWPGPWVGHKSQRAWYIRVPGKLDGKQVAVEMEEAPTHWMPLPQGPQSDRGTVK